MFARFDENPAMTLQDIKKKNVTDGQMHARIDERTDNVKTVYPPQTKFAGGITTILFDRSRPQDRSAYSRLGMSVTTQGGSGRQCVTGPGRNISKYRFVLLNVYLFRQT